ncbi:MAG: DUF1570 domain-containing protein [Planctomycetota bacterium]|jgi:HEAT repeat protein
MRALVAFLLVVSAAHAAPRATHSWRTAVSVEGRHFVVKTNTYRELAQDLSATLERSYALYEDRFGPLDGPARRPMHVRLYRTRDEYMQDGEGVQGALGHFDPSLDACALVWGGGTGEAGWPIAVHEACHQYVRRRFGRIRLPSWYSEGIACWFEGLQTQATHDRISRVRYDAAVAALRAGQARLDTLLDNRKLVTGGRLQTEGLTPARYYGLAWSLVHFLVTDARYAASFRRFELRLFASRPTRGGAAGVARDLLEEECGPLDTLEARWRKHIAGLRSPPAITAAAVYRWDLASSRAYTRFAALRRVLRRPFPKGLEAPILACVGDPDVIVRTEAARLMQRDPRGAAADELVRSLDWGDPTLKNEALHALAHESMGRAVPRLMREKTDREGAARALAAIGDKRTYGRLRTAAVNLRFSASTRARCLTALRDDPAAIHILRTQSKSRERSVRAAARAALLKLQRRRPTLTERQAEMQDDMILSSAPNKAVARGGARGLIEVIADPSRDAQERARACVVLGVLRAGEAVPALKRLCRNGVDPTIRLEAVRSLVRITGETRGFQAGQSARAREAVYRRWASGS